MNINEALNGATKELKKARIESARLDAEILLCYAIATSEQRSATSKQKNANRKSRIWLYQNPTYNLQLTTYNFYKKLIARRKKYEPIAYLTHRQEFFGLDFWVDKNVLIPRPETELLVEEALSLVSKPIPPSPVNIIDVGTGSGCIIVALATKLKIKNEKLKTSLYAIDISKKALKIARKNAKLHKVDKKIKFLHGDLLKPLLGLSNKGQVTRKNLLIPKPLSLSPCIIVANLPYLTSKTYNLSPSLHYEPQIALDGGKNGLKLYRRFFKQVSALIRVPSASIRILSEIDPSQTRKIKHLIKQYLPSCKIEFKKDLVGKNRIVIIEVLNF